MTLFRNENHLQGAERGSTGAGVSSCSEAKRVTNPGQTLPCARSLWLLPLQGPCSWNGSRPLSTSSPSFCDGFHVPCKLATVSQLKKDYSKNEILLLPAVALARLPASLCVFTASSPTRVQCVHSSCQPPGYPVTHSCRHLQVTIVVSFEALGRYQVECTAVVWKLRESGGRPNSCLLER